MTSHQAGIGAALTAYGLWGLLPVYWKALQMVPATQVLGHRIVWSFLFLGGLVVWRREGATLRAAMRQPATLRLYAAAALLLSVNWLTYIWAVQSGRIVESSLGYFINPLVSVLLGVVFLRESLRRLQAVAVAIAGLGVVYLTWRHGSLPWVALTLAVSFGLYGLVKKRAPLGALSGLTLETGVLVLPAVGFLVLADVGGRGALGHAPAWVNAMLILTGAVTASPLLLFAYGAKRLNLATIGLLQYVAPTLQFLLGVLMYGEPFTSAHAVGFGLIWGALGLYWAEGIWYARRRRN